MTYADEIGIPGEGQEEAPNYPTAFGITFTPRVAGVTFGVLGLLAATYLLLNVVQPAWQRYQELQSSVADKKSQIQQQEEIQRQIREKQAQLVQAKQRNKQVLNLFASEKTLDTLLLNLNSFVKARNGTLVNYEPVPEQAGQQASGQDTTGVVNDGSLGAEVNGKLKRKVYNVVLDGSFDQVQSMLRSFERLQSLLVVKDLKSELHDKPGFLINTLNGRATPAVFRTEENNKVVPGGKPTIRTTFKLEALTPVTEEDTQANNTAKKPGVNAQK